MAPAEQGRSSRASADARRRLLDVLAPVVASSGFDFEDVTVALVGRRRLVRVVVDADGGVDLDGIAEVSRAVSAALDEGADAADQVGVFAGPYVLEVTSPGIDRPLTETRHWRHSIGRLVQVEVAGVPTLGRVKGVDEADLHLDVDGEVRAVAWDEVGAGHVQVEFTRADGPETDGPETDGPEQE